MKPSKEIDIKLLAPTINVVAMVVLITVSLVGYQVICWRTSNRVTELNNEAIELQEKLTQTAFLKVRLNQLEKQKQEFDKKNRELVSPVRFDGIDEESQLTTYLVREMRDADFRQTRIVGGQAALPLSGKSISAIAEGSFEKVCRLLQQIKNLPANVRLERLSITSEQQSVPQLKMRFGLEQEVIQTENIVDPETADQT